jgi:mannose-1-phosphate guanylyltransferase
VQALILAGGEGTRLRPLTSSVPKPVLPLANRPFISYMLDWLALHGFDDVVMSCGFLAAEVRSVLGDGDGTVRIRYVEEDTPLGTAGAVKHAEGLLGERFAVLNGDILADFDLSALRNFHEQRQAVATISLIPVEDPSAYGLVRTADDGAIEAFVEKPSPDEIDTNLINAGAYVLEHEVLDRIEPGRMTSFEREVFPSLIGAGLYGHSAHGYWLDIGTPERYLEATRDILDGTDRTVVGERLEREHLALGTGTAIADGARLEPPVLVGDRCEVAAGAVVGPHSVIGDDCSLDEGAIVERSVLHSGVELGRGAVVRDSIVAADARIGAGSRLEHGVLVGSGVELEANSTPAAGERIEVGAPASAQ